MGRCHCACHIDDDSSAGAELLDEIGRVTACSRCANEHWRAFYESTQPKPRAKQQSEWIDPPAAQNDGWQSDA